LNGFAATVSDLARAGLMADVRVQDIEADQIVTAEHDVPGGAQANPQLRCSGIRSAVAEFQW